MHEESEARRPSPPGRPKTPLVLTNDEHTVLTGWAECVSTSEPLALRSRIVLACSTGASNTSVAEDLGVSRPTVGKWRARFLQRRLDGLDDEPRPGRPPSLSLDEIRALLGTPCPPSVRGDRTGSAWTRGALARHTGLSTSTVARLWRNLENPDPQGDRNTTEGQ